MPIPPTRSAGPFPPTAPTLAYRVEHREGARVRSLGRLERVPAHHTSLEPYVSALLRDGDGGELLLVDAVTGAVVARRAVRPYRSKSRDRFRR